MAHTALTNALTPLGNMRSTSRIAGNLSLRHAATTKARPPTRRLGVLAGAPVQASNCITAYEHRLTREDKSHRPAQPSLSRLSSTIAHNDDSNNNVKRSSSNSTAASPDAAEELLRAMPNSLQGIGEALTLEDLKPTAPWGLAVYRTTYADDAAWGRMRDALFGAVANALELYGCTASLLPRLSHAFIEDRATLAGAGVRDVRRRFTVWAAEELRRNWRVGATPAMEEDACRAGVEGPGYFVGPRYNFCLLVDEVCLESLDRMASPVVKLVEKDFTDEEERGGGRSGVVASSGWEDGLTDSEEEDVGWMYLPVADYVDCCNQLHDPEFWHDGYYVRPPLTFLNRDFASAPGFWRREGHDV